MSRRFSALLTATFITVIGAARADATPIVVFQDDFDSSPLAGSGVTALYSGGISDSCPVCWSVQSIQNYGSTGLGFSGSFLYNGNPMGHDLQPSAILTLTGLPSHSTVNLDFLLAVIDSWDGGGFGGGPDTFNVTVGDGTSSSTVFAEVFDNAVWQATAHCTDRSPCLTGETYTGTGVRGVQLWNAPSVPSWASPGFEDAGYDLGGVSSLNGIPHTSSTLVIQWFATSGATNGAGYAWGDYESWALDNLNVSLDSGPSEVPEPTSLVLLGSGTAAVLAARRRRRARR